MKVLVWATTFGADLWSFTRYLDAQPDIELKVVMKDPSRFLEEPIAQLFPMRAQIIERTAAVQAFGVSGFRPDVTIFDNEVPPPPAKSPCALALWHGYGWKGPNDRREMRACYLQIRLSWGDPTRPNERFRWSCFGPKDFGHRTQTAGLDPSNCRLLGAASHDDLRQPFDRSRAQPYYPFDIVSRPTVLIAPTWHYGEVFAHWGGDAQVLEPLLQTLAERGVNVILRLHDSFRFDATYRSFLDGLAERHAHVLLKYKDRNPDNFIDLQVSDVLVTNYSSIANLFYATGRPTVHVYPVRSADETFIWRRRSLFGISKSKVESVRYVWKFPPEEHGGSLARSAEELMTQVCHALDEPRAYEARAREFLDREMLGADGHNCERILAAVREMVHNVQRG